MLRYSSCGFLKTAAGDLVVSLLTGFYRNGTLIMVPAQIWLHYVACFALLSKFAKQPSPSEPKHAQTCHLNLQISSAEKSAQNDEGPVVVLDVELCLTNLLLYI